MKKIKKLIIAQLFVCSGLFADGVMLPQNADYPKDLLKSRMTKVTVDIDGAIARTSVYQEFVNEWNDTTDAVYSFPLPTDAKATNIFYWHEGIAYQAVLKVQEQATNPGTGEGGVAAIVNSYIGRNGIKIALKDIPPGEIQKIQLDYIQPVDYYTGSYTYQYPLQTEDLISYPIDHLEFIINVQSPSPVSDIDIPDFPDYSVTSTDSNHFSIRVICPKAYLNRNFKITYSTIVEELGVDFYSVQNDTSAGHFALFIYPPNQVSSDSLLPRRILFLISNSTLMFGYKLNESISAVKYALDQLNENDQFNIGLYNYNVQFWKTTTVTASTNNIESAKNYLDELEASGGSNLQNALEQALEQITDNSYNNSIIIFTNGFSFIYPDEIESVNSNKTGIFPIAIGDNFNFARLETLAVLNYGFVTYIGENDNMTYKMNRLIDQVTHPIFKDVSMEYGAANLSDILPVKIPSFYAGKYFFMVGRYENSGHSSLSIAGTSNSGTRYLDFSLNFSDAVDDPKFIEPFWAKQMIDYLEWQIEIYGETDALKNTLIDISLSYNIRCRYTAYIADYSTEEDDGSYVTEELSPLAPVSSYLINNYPNPFNPVTTIVFYIGPRHQAKSILIFNSLGQLVRTIDISPCGQGVHEIKFDGRDQNGNLLPSGVYFVILSDTFSKSALRIMLIK